MVTRSAAESKRPHCVDCEFDPFGIHELGVLCKALSNVFVRPGDFPVVMRRPAGAGR